MEITKQTQDDFVAAIKSILEIGQFFQDCKYETFVHHFLGFRTHPSKCQVHIFSVDDLAVVIFQDVGHDSGTSVTNASEQLATEIGRLKNLSYDKTAWMECYPREKHLDLDRIAYLYDPEKNAYLNPQWTPYRNETFIAYLRRYIKTAS